MTAAMRCTLPPTGAPAAEAARIAAALPRLETARCVLRAPTLADLPLWTALHQGPDGAMLGGPLDDEDAYLSFCGYVAGWLLHGHGLWSVERKGDGARIGFVLVGLEWGDAEPELGWMVAEDARRRGYGTEAATAALAHARSLLPGVVSYVGPGNAPSARIAERLGARRDPAAEAALGGGSEVWRHTGIGRPA